MKHFETAEVLFMPNPEERSIWAVLPGSKTNWGAIVRIEDEELEVLAIHPLRIPEEKRAALAELIIRIGPRSNLCTLEMDYDEGRLTARSHLYFESGTELCDEVIFGAISISLNALESVHQAVVGILYQTKNAVEAVQMLEEEGGSECEQPNANRFNLPKPEGEVPWPELPEEGLRNN